MNSKYKKPHYKDMASVVGQCVKLNMNRIIFSVLMFYFLFTVLMFSSTVPALSFSRASSNAGISASIIMIAIFGLITILAFMLVYGLNIAVSKVIEREDSGSGILFSAFKANTGKIFLSSVIFLILGFIAIEASVAIFFVIFKNDEFLLSLAKSLTIDFINENIKVIARYVVTLALLMIAFLFILFLPFVFVWLNLYTNPKINVFRAFGRSVRMLFGKVFHFIGFVIYSTWKPLLVMIFARLISFYCPEKLAFLSLILSFAGFAAEIILIARCMLSYTVYYYFLTGNITVSSPDVNAQVLEVRDALPEDSLDDVIHSNLSVSGSDKDSDE